MLTYCLFCETTKCDFVARVAEALFPCQAIVPKQIQHTWSKGDMVNIVRNLLPGYLFLYSDEPLNMGMAWVIQDVIRCIHGNREKYELEGSDREFALLMMERGGVLGKTKVYEKDGVLQISPKAFKRVRTEILKVDHRASRMKISFTFAGKPVQTWVEYEITDEHEEQPDD